MGNARGTKIDGGGGEPRTIKRPIQKKRKRRDPRTRANVRRKERVNPTKGASGTQIALPVAGAEKTGTSHGWVESSLRKSGGNIEVRAIYRRGDSVRDA